MTTQTYSELREFASGLKDCGYSREDRRNIIESDARSRNFLKATVIATGAGIVATTIASIVLGTKYNLSQNQVIATYFGMALPQIALLSARGFDICKRINFRRDLPQTAENQRYAKKTGSLIKGQEKFTQEALANLLM
jgi:ABC-type lipoprotein release transport system permease subunit